MAGEDRASDRRDGWCENQANRLRGPAAVRAEQDVVDESGELREKQIRDVGAEGDFGDDGDVDDD